MIWQILPVFMILMNEERICNRILVFAALFAYCGVWEKVTLILCFSADECMITTKLDTPWDQSGGNCRRTREIDISKLEFKSVNGHIDHPRVNIVPIFHDPFYDG
jgi:hypothetical protein